MRCSVLVGCTIPLVFACGGDGKKVKKPAKEEVVEQTEKPETEADREKKRVALAHAIIPEGSTCLPPALKDENAPRLELAASGADAILCAVDVDRERLLGPIGCWKVDLASGALEYKAPELMPGRGIQTRVEDGCVRGYCLPKDAKSSANVAHIARSVDGGKVAVLVGDDVHLFDAESKDHQSSFSIRGDKGVTNDPTGVHFVGEAVIVEGADDGAYSAVWVFKTDGTAVGPVTTLGGKEEKPISTHRGSLSILDKNRIGVSEKGMETLTTYQLDNGARAKLVRKVGKAACKPAEIDAFWHNGDKVTDKCKNSMNKLSGHLMGATAVAGAKNFLVLLRGDRLGELGVLDAKSLAEKKAIKLPWCEGDGGGGGEKEADAKNEADAKDDEDAEEKASPRGGSKLKAAPKKASSDPEEGGE